MKYGKLESGSLVDAPKVVRVGGAVVVNPKPAQLQAAGYMPVIDSSPEPVEGKIFRRTGWEVRDGAICAVFAMEDIPPPPPRTFSKLKVVAALMKAGVWAQVKQYIMDADLYDLYLAAQDFAEDNDYFMQGRTSLQTALGWTDKQVEAVLAASVIQRKGNRKDA